MSPVDEHVVSFLVAWAGFKTIQHLVSVDIHVHFALSEPSLILAKKLINRKKNAQITVLRGNCGDHKIIFTTFRDVGKPEQVKSKHHHSFLFLCKEKEPPLSFAKILISKHQHHYSCHRLQPSLLTCRVLWTMAGRSNEEELEEVISSFRRIWRSGGRASLSLHANQGELEVGLFILMEALLLLFELYFTSFLICLSILCRHVWIFSLGLAFKRMC